MKFLAYALPARRRFRVHVLLHRAIFRRAPCDGALLARPCPRVTEAAIVLHDQIVVRGGDSLRLRVWAEPG